MVAAQQVRHAGWRVAIMDFRPYGGMPVRRTRCKISATESGRADDDLGSCDCGSPTGRLRRREAETSQHRMQV